jgi:excisionase family DNA binding protein
LTTSTNFYSAPLDPAEWISQAQAARLRQVSRQAIAKLVGNGRLRTLEVGGRRFVSRADVLAFEPNPPGRPKGAGSE